MKKFIVGALLLGVAMSGNATTLALDTSGGEEHSPVAYGQSVTTPDGGPWDTIDFNLIEAQTGGAYAFGGLYVLTQAYAGTAATLSASTPGYLGFTNTISNGAWDFSGVTLQADTQYFFFMNSSVGQDVLLDPTNAYAGGIVYGDAGGGAFGSVPTYDIEFRLTGNQVSSSSPEPGTMALFGGAAALLAVFRRRRNGRQSTEPIL